MRTPGPSSSASLYSRQSEVSIQAKRTACAKVQRHEGHDIKKNTHAAFWLKNKVPVKNKQSGKGGNLRKDYKLFLLFKFRSYRKFEKVKVF